MTTCCVWQFGYIGIYGHLIGFLGHIAAIIVTGVFRYNTAGVNCAMNDTQVSFNEEGEGFTFKEHGNMIQGLFISSCSLLLCFNCFVCFMMTVSRTLIQLNREVSDFIRQ